MSASLQSDVELLSNMTRYLYTIWTITTTVFITTLLHSGGVIGYVYTGSGLKSDSYCTNFQLGRLLLGCSDGLMVQIVDSIIFSKAEPTVRLKALGNQNGCEHSSRCVITFQTYHSGWDWLNCLNVSYSCVTAKCPSLTAPVFGSVTVNSHTPRGQAVYQCDHGYKLKGQSVTRCVHHNNRYYWNPGPPTCEYDCRNLVPSPHAVGAYQSMCYEFILIRKKWYTARADCHSKNGSLISYESMDFFETAFDTTPEITIPGTTWAQFWTANEKYRPRHCKMLFVNTKNTVEHYTRWLECTLPLYYICEYEPVHPKRCGILPVPENGVKSFTNESVGTVVEFSCYDGYVINGSRTRRCLSSGMWSGEEPSCVLIHCHIPKPLNGSDSMTLHIANTTYASFANYSCHAGHVLVGDSVRMCTGNGSWSGTDPICEFITTTTTTTSTTTRVTTVSTTTIPTTTQTTCPSADTINNTNVVAIHYENTSALAVAIYTCSAGHYMEGEARRICMRDGTWNGTAPICKVIIQPEVAASHTRQQSGINMPMVVIIVLVFFVIIVAVILIFVVLIKSGKLKLHSHQKLKCSESITNPMYMEIHDNQRNGAVVGDLAYSDLTRQEDSMYNSLTGNDEGIYEDIDD